MIKWENEDTIDNKLWQRRFQSLDVDCKYMGHGLRELFRIDQHLLGHTTLLINGACGVFFDKEFTTATITSVTATPRRPVAIRAII